MKTKRSAFTLIELLVVVAIIALLIALLLPALGRAKILSQRTACGTNMRSISMALVYYFNESSNINPYWGMYGGYKKADETMWPVALSPYLGIEAVASAPMETTTSGKFATFAQTILGNRGKRSPLFCQLYSNPLPELASWTYPSDFTYTTYAAIGVVWSPSKGYLYLDESEVFLAASPPNDPYGLRSIDSSKFNRNLSQRSPSTPVFAHTPGRSMTLVDAVDPNWWLTISMWGTFSHGNQPPLGFLDGHVEFISAAEILADYWAAGGNATGTGLPNFGARYGPFGQTPLYGYGTHSSTDLRFKPW